MNLDVFFLGTAASVPTTTRITTATLVRRGGERILVDCGEGAQRRLMQSAVGLVDVDLILLTHAHADHYLGLPGLLKTFDLRERVAPLTVYGPPGTSALASALQPLVGRVTYPFVAVDVEPGGSIQCAGYHLEAVPTVHRVPSIGWALVEEARPGRFDVAEARRRGVPEGPAFGVLQQGGEVRLPDASIVRSADVVGEPRPGRRVVISGDTRPCDGVLAAALGASLLVHEATFMHEEQARARETRHSTAREAARLAAEAGVAMLVLTHISTRYAPRAVRDEARREFAATYVPRDLDAVEIPFPERGGPRIVHANYSSRPNQARREAMSAMVPIYVAADITEADEVRRMLAAASIVAQLEPVAEAIPPADTGDGPCRVLVADEDRDAAMEVLRAEAAEADGEQW